MTRPKLVTRAWTGSSARQLALTLTGAVLALAVTGCTGVVPSASSPAGSAVATEPPSVSGQPPTPSEPSSAPIACVEQTSVESPSLAPAPSFLPPGSRVRVLVDGLCVREETSVTSAVTATLPEGAEIAIDGTFDVWGPIKEDGITWYPAGRPYFGWVAGERGDERYLELSSFRCPADRDLAAVLRMTPWERLSCFGAEPLELRGVVENACQGGARVGVYEPEWLARWCFVARLTDQASPAVEPTGWIQLAFSPSFGAPSKPYPDLGSVVRVVGHFDDSAAATCRVIPSDDHEWSQPAVLVLCREQFVVTDVEVVGHLDLPPGA